MMFQLWDGIKAACSINGELTEPNRTTLNLKIVKSLSGLSNSDIQRKWVYLWSSSASCTWRKAFSISVDSMNLCVRNLSSKVHMSIRNGGPTTRQSFKLGCLEERQQLQSYTILTGVVTESFWQHGVESVLRYIWFIDSFYETLTELVCNDGTICLQKFC